MKKRTFKRIEDKDEDYLSPTTVLKKNTKLQKRRKRISKEIDKFVDNEFKKTFEIKCADEWQK